MPCPFCKKVNIQQKIDDDKECGGWYHYNKQSIHKKGLKTERISQSLKK